MTRGWIVFPMRQSLNRHAVSQSPASSVEVDIIRTVEMLALRFAVTGDIDRLVIPELTNPTRADELWKHTCFEAFIRPERGGSYCEFNLSATGQWAAYRFTGYREGMANIAEASDPGVGTRSILDRFELRASIDLTRLPELSGPWEVGLSAILEETGGNKSYWALKHPAGKPDFHHADCFALRLPSAG